MNGPGFVTVNQHLSDTTENETRLVVHADSTASQEYNARQCVESMMNYAPDKESLNWRRPYGTPSKKNESTIGQGVGNLLLASDWLMSSGWPLKQTARKP